MLPSVFQSKNARSRGQITNSNESVLIQIQISATMLINSTRIGATLSWPSSLSSNRWRSSWLAPNPAKKLLNLTYDSNDSARLSLRFSWASVIQKKMGPRVAIVFRGGEKDLPLEPQQFLMAIGSMQLWAWHNSLLWFVSIRRMGTLQ